MHTGKLDRLAVSTSAASPLSHKIGNGKNKNLEEDIITITEKINLTRNQHQALKIFCDIYQQTLAEYIHHALVQTMKSDIEDGNIAIALLERLEDRKTEKESRKSETSEVDVDTSSIFEKLTRLNHLG